MVRALPHLEDKITFWQIIMVWVTFDDMRKANFCAKGSRAMFRRYGIDVNKVVLDRGIDAEELKQKTGEHAMVARVISLAEERERGQE